MFYILNTDKNKPVLDEIHRAKGFQTKNEALKWLELYELNRREEFEVVTYWRLKYKLGIDPEERVS